MERNGRSLSGLPGSAVKGPAPAYFALAMATGIVSLAGKAMGIPSSPDHLSGSRGPSAEFRGS